MEKTTTLTEKTLIPISVVVLVFGAAMWLTNVWAQGQANAQRITELKISQDHDLDKIYHQLEIIDEKIDRVISKQK